ncbi:MAG: BolA family transcriptional regulator [Acidiferrobacterales bacterium]|nr:BolA family transcriptional regulator [Acidiferrobacterales bacterium]
MRIQTQIEQKLLSLDPAHIEVINESGMHNVPEGSESHFKVTVVTPQFEGKMLIQRHRMINELLQEELEGEVHALSLHTKTPDEWFEQGGVIGDSPLCLGGSAAENIEHQSE